MSGVSSLFSQKKGAVYSFALLAAVLLLVVGIISVSGLHARTVTLTPGWSGINYANQTYNFSISNSNGNTINLVRITKPTSFTEVYCGWVPSGWTCGTNGTTALQTFVEFTGGSLAAGASATFNITSTTSSSAGDYAFTVRTEDDGSSFNSTTVNTGIDTVKPILNIMNVSDGTRILSSGGHLDGTLFLSNSTGKVTIIFNATDNESGIKSLTLYYNASNLSDGAVYMANHTGANSYDAAIVMSNISSGPGTLWNATLDNSNVFFNLFNNTRVVFTVVANDTVRNGNVSNYTSVVSDRVFNFSVDSVPPQINLTLIETPGGTNSINTTATGRNGFGFIVNSSARLNLNSTVRDDGGAGVVNVQVIDRTGAALPFSVLTGSNGSNGATTWNFSRFNVTDLVNGYNGDGLYNISIRATDNVSNQNTTYNFSVFVDDSQPSGFVTTNMSVNGVLSPGNATLNIATNASFNVTLTLSDNIDNRTKNVSVFGNRGLIFNLTYVGNTTAGNSIWFIEIANNSNSTNGINATNLSAFCDTITSADGQQCNLRFNFTDVLGRSNSSINLTLYVDANAPAVFRISPLTLTTNYTGTALVNFSVNDSVGNLMNVSFRIRNDSSSQTEGAYSNASVMISNVTNWIPMTISTGNNSQPGNAGTWYYTINLTATNFTDGNYTIEVNATDSAGRQNATAFAVNVYFDSTIPTNFSLIRPSTNSFHLQNNTLNISVNASDNFRGSGLLNVSFRLENGTFTSQWVTATTEILSGLNSRLNATNVNLTHWGSGTMNASLNATNGNFTLRLNVTDTSGNQNTTFTVNFTIDTVLPLVSFVNPLTNLNQSGNFTVNASVTESNVLTAQYRWVNHSLATSTGPDNMSNRSTWISLTRALTASTFNATFTNLTDGSIGGFVGGNYSLEINVTDFAGNTNTSVFVQFLLDRSAPAVVGNGPAAASQQVADFVVNMSVNDTGFFNPNIGLINSTNVNGSLLFRLENSTSNGTWTALQFASADFTNANSNRTNATFTFSSVANGNYDVRLWVNDTAGNQNSTVLIKNVTLDTGVPSVAASAVNVTPSVTGGSSITGTMTLNVSVSDNLPLNISITNFTSSQGATYGVFYRFENSTHNQSWLPMISSVFASQSVHSATFNFSNGTTVLADGDYFVRLNATDKAGNQNASVFISVTVQNGATVVQVKNITFLGRFVTGSDTNQTSPTLLWNTTANATCRYSLDTPVTYYDDMTNTMSNNVSRQHNRALGFLPDRSSNGYNMYYACKDVGGNFTAAGGAASSFTFSVDTRNYYNVTLGSVGNNKVRGDYFAQGWNSFALPKTTLLGNTGLPTNYNITNVLASLGSSTLATANFTTIFSYNGTAWASYVVGAVTNTFNNFTADTPASTYYINITTTNERLEIN